MQTSYVFRYISMCSSWFASLYARLVADEWAQGWQYLASTTGEHHFRGCIILAKSGCPQLSVFQEACDLGLCGGCIRPKNHKTGK